MTAAPDTILILGMHRSGTSALTRVLALCGAALPRTVFPPSAGDNDTGYWESTPVIDFHQRLLWRLHSGYLDPHTPPARWFGSADMESAADELAAILRAEWDGTTGPWAVKDPRMCRLVPLWRAALKRLGRAPLALHCLRAPGEVAASLAQRNGFARPTAEFLWAQHVALAERDTRDCPRIFLRYADLIADWRAVLERVAAAVPGLDARRASAEIDRFLDPARRRQRNVERTGDNAAVEGVQRAMFDGFDDAAHGEPDRRAIDELLPALTR